MPADDEDDLTLIRGIGPVRQAWLRERLGVRSFADLAALDLDRARLALTGRPSAPSAEEIARWVRDARKFTEHTELAADANGGDPAPTTQDWSSVSTFIIDFLMRHPPGEARAFKTLAEQMEPDAPASQVREEWGGIETRASHAWMVGRLRTTLEARGMPVESIGHASPSSEEPAEAEDPDLPGKKFDRADKTQAARCDRLQEPAARAVLERIEIRVGSARDRLERPYLRAEPLRVARGMPIIMLVSFSIEGEIDAFSAAPGELFMASLRILDLSNGHIRRVAGDAHPALSSPHGTALIRVDVLPPGRYCSWISVSATDCLARPATERGPNLLIE